MNSSVREEEIRPADLFQEYLLLSIQDIHDFFANEPRENLTCPACDSEGDFAFEKLGFSYRECANCWSLWVSPRPTFESYVAFYSKSASSRYWAEVFYPAVEVVRREKLWRPKVRKILEITSGFSVTYRNLVDIGGGSGTFAEEFSALSDTQVTVIEPSPEAAATCRLRGIEVIESFLEEVQVTGLPAGPTIFTSFELLEHVHNPRHWLQSISDLMRSGDIAIITTLSSLGVDIRTLWEQSDSVTPPHHINFLNPAAMSILAARVGLSPLKIFTPGVLDLDIMKNNYNKLSDRFWRSILDASDAEKLSDWQQFISESGRSSHMWAVFQKP